MNCESVQKNASLFLYGELSLEQEQELQDHLDLCQPCRKAIEGEKAIHRALDAREMEPPAVLPADSQWPAHWLRPEAAPALVRFVDTRFEPERTTSEIRRLFGGVRQISANPMPLRAIFVTLARSASKA